MWSMANGYGALVVCSVLVVGRICVWLSDGFIIAGVRMWHM